MNVFQTPNLDDTADVEFDRLCSLCAGLFNGQQWWSHDRDLLRDRSFDRPHHDINSIVRASEGYKTA